VLVGVQLLVYGRQIRQRPDDVRLPARRRGEQQFFQAPVIAIGWQRPAQLRRCRTLQIAMNGSLRDITAACNLLLGEPQGEA
jgi:hypothetical protein